MKTTDKGLLLYKTNYSESSLIITFYTESQGLRKYIFKGAKKKKLPIMAFGNYEINSFKRPESELGIINSMSISTPHLSSVSHPLKVLISFFISDVLRQTLREEQADPQLFHFLMLSAEDLNETKQLSTFPIEFLVKLIEHLGVSPKTIKNATHFNMLEGSFTSNGKAPCTKEEELADYLNSLFTTSLAPPKELEKEAMLVLLKYMQLHLPLFDTSRSLAIIKEVLYS